MAKAQGVRLVVLISGRGSNFEALQQHLSGLEHPIADVVGVVSDQPQALGIQKAQAMGVPTLVVNATDYPTKPAFETQLVKAVEAFNPDWVILAGLMRVLGQTFLSAFHGNMLNIHPSLLPKYRGLHTHQRAIEAGETTHGASIHFVTSQLDGGPVLSQIQIPINPTDDAVALAERLLPQEHRLMKATVALLVNHDVQCHDGQITLNEQTLTHPMVLDRDFNDAGELLARSD